MYHLSSGKPYRIEYWETIMSTESIDLSIKWYDTSGTSGSSHLSYSYPSEIYKINVLPIFMKYMYNHLILYTINLDGACVLNSWSWLLSKAKTCSDYIELQGYQYTDVTNFISWYQDIKIKLTPNFIFQSFMV